MDCIPGLPDLHHLPKFAQIHIHGLCYPTILSSATPPPALSLSQHQGLFQRVGSLHQCGQSTGASASESVIPVNIQGWFSLRLTDLLLSKVLSSIFSSTIIKSLNSLELSLLYAPTFISVPDYWENHSFDYRDLFQQIDVSAFYTSYPPWVMYSCQPLFLFWGFPCLSCAWIPCFSDYIFLLYCSLPHYVNLSTSK